MFLIKKTVRKFLEKLLKNQLKSKIKYFSVEIHVIISHYTICHIYDQKVIQIMEEFEKKYLIDLIEHDKTIPLEWE